MFARGKSVFTKLCQVYIQMDEDPFQLPAHDANIIIMIKIRQQPNALFPSLFLFGGDRRLASSNSRIAP